MFVLSLSALHPCVAQGCVSELEQVFAELTGATILCPRSAAEFVETVAGLKPAQDDLFVACLSINDVIGLFGRANGWHRPFRRVFCYVFDAWVNEYEVAKSALRHRVSPYSRVIRQLDHLFVSNPDSVQQYEAVYRIPVTYVPLAADVLQFGSLQPQRPITVNAYGRQHPPHVEILSRTFNSNRSSRALHHTDHVAIGAVSSLRQHRAHFWKLLSMSCITLAYDPVAVDPGSRSFPFSFIGQRWFEGLAAGCVVVGIRPNCDEAARLLHWKDATLEAPREPEDFLEFIDGLLADGSRLARIRVSNHRQMLLEHDWGYRVAGMLAVVGVDAPPAWANRRARLLAALPRAHDEAAVTHS